MAGLGSHWEATLELLHQARVFATSHVGCRFNQQQVIQGMLGEWEVSVCLCWYTTRLEHGVAGVLCDSLVGLTHGLACSIASVTDSD
jgi:hypothetical protein